MNTRKRRPSWWQLWLLLPVLGILAFLDVGVSMPALAHRIVEIGFVVVIFGSVAAWLRANEVAMVREISDGAVWREADEPALVSAPGAAGVPSRPGVTAGPRPASRPLAVEGIAVPGKGQSLAESGGLSPQPGAIAGRNGDGRRSNVYLAGKSPEPDKVYGDPEEEK